jgi:suppressor for copper-sensitivity B
MIRALTTGLLLLATLAAPGQTADAAASGWASEAHGAARLISRIDATGSGAEFEVGLQLRLTAGWHTYWRTPGDAGIPPSIDWTGSDNLSEARIAWPAPYRLPATGGLETIGYEDGVVLPITVRLAHPGSALHLHAEVDYASCKDVCIPYHASLVLVIPPGPARPGPEAALIAAARAKVPVGLASAGLGSLDTVVEAAERAPILAVRVASTGAPLRAPDLFVEGVQKGSPGRPDVLLADAGRVATFRIPIRGDSAAALAGTRLDLTLVDGDRSAEAQAVPQLGTPPPLAGRMIPVSIIGLALLGGLILNLMPCVLPVLSLKLLALIGYAGSERRQARLGLIATAAGVIVSFGVLAVTVVLLKAAGAAIGWGIQFQQPWFLAGMALMTTLFAASLWRWVRIELPGGVASAVGSVRGRSRLADAFLLGTFATLLAVSCSAPFVGTAVGFALARGPIEIILIFAALGLGMAAPFLIVAAWPGLVSWLPRPGPWMDWLRSILGLALLGTAAWLLSVLGTEAGLWTALATGAALLALLAVLAIRSVLRFGSRGNWLVATAALVLSIVAVLVPSLRGQAVPIATPAGNIEAGLWQPFDASALQGMVAQGKVVFVDVSAAWCLTCKVNEMIVLDRAPVSDRLRQEGVVAMRADWTRSDTTIAAYLHSFGRYGVPLDVIYGPAAPNGIALPELLTPGAVMAAFERAAASPARHEEKAQ